MSKASQQVCVSVNDLVESRVIDSPVLGYYIAKVQLFLTSIGLKYVRWRQHRSDERAHYAQDCWDAECLTSYGWVECVGIADRSAYDLTCHMAGSGKELYAYETLPEPITVQRTKLVLNKNVIGAAFGSNTKSVLDYLGRMDRSQMNGEFDICDGAYHITTNMYKVVTMTKKKTQRKYVPSVIEPSFGIGRILYACLEQNYWVRPIIKDSKKNSKKNEKRAVFSIPSSMAYRQVGVLSLSNNGEFTERINRICQELSRRRITYQVDNSKASIGKKYARLDELGVPFCITYNFEGNNYVTLRERDSTRQIRIPETDICHVLTILCDGTTIFEFIGHKYGFVPLKEEPLKEE